MGCVQVTLHISYSSRRDANHREKCDLSVDHTVTVCILQGLAHARCNHQIATPHSAPRPAGAVRAGRQGVK